MEALWYMIVGNSGSGAGVLRFLIVVIAILLIAFFAIDLTLAS